jgi:signal transduction histidine kinase
MEIMLYRIVQELLNNIIKHANATEVIIQFNKHSEKLSITIEDNGRGFNVSEVTDQSGAGLDTIQSRVDYLNGHLNIDSTKGVGTTVMMEFKLEEQVA